MNTIIRHIASFLIVSILLPLSALAKDRVLSQSTYEALVLTCDSAVNDKSSVDMFKHAHKTVILANMLESGNTNYDNYAPIDSVHYYKSVGLYYMGRYYLEVGRETSNKHYYQLARNYFRNVINSENIKEHLPDVVNYLAEAYHLNSQTDSAIYIYQNNIDRCKNTNNLRPLSNAYLHLGIIYSEKKIYNKAESYLTNALNIQQENKDDASTSTTLVELGKVHMAQNDLSKARSYIQKALSISANRHIVATYISALHASYTLARENKDENTALYYLEKEVALRDSMLKRAIMSRESGIQAQYQIQIKESQIDALQKQNEIDAMRLQQANEQSDKRWTALIFMHIIIIIAILFAVYYLMQTRKQKKMNIDLQRQYELINYQKEELAAQRDKMTAINDSVHDSIRYASKIQRKVMNGANEGKNVFPLSFVLYKPKEIVSGDFYYIKQVGDYKIAAVADCTGHGVPATLLSILCLSFLNEEISSCTEPHADTILENIRARIKDTLYTEGSDDTVLDGCDMGITILKNGTRQMEYAGANIDLYIARRKMDLISDNYDIEILKATRNPLGWHLKEQPFNKNTVTLNSGDTIYMFSDGYRDQIGNEGSFGATRIKLLLEQIAPMTLNEQRRELQSTLSSWMGTNVQVDDITFLGIKYLPRNISKESLTLT